MAVLPWLQWLLAAGMQQDLPGWCSACPQQGRQLQQVVSRRLIQEPYQPDACAHTSLTPAGRQRRSVQLLWGG